MSWLSWVAPNRNRAWLKKVLTDSEKKTAEQWQLFGDLVSGIVSAAWDCTQHLKPDLRPVAAFEEHPETQVMYLFYEFLYFFLHLMNRQVAVRLSPEIGEALRHEIGPYISGIAVDTFCAHWPEKYKFGIQREFIERLTDAEAEYVRCNTLTPDAGLIADTALSSRLAVKVLDVAGYSADLDHLQESDIVLIRLTASLIVDILTTGSLRNFGDMVEHAGVAVTQFNKNAERR